MVSMALNKASMFLFILSDTSNSMSSCISFMYVGKDVQGLKVITFFMMDSKAGMKRGLQIKGRKG
jgi:hypothetical protein